MWHQQQASNSNQLKAPVNRILKEQNINLQQNINHKTYDTPDYAVKESDQGSPMFQQQLQYYNDSKMQDHQTHQRQLSMSQMNAYGFTGVRSQDEASYYNQSDSIAHMTSEHQQHVDELSSQLHQTTSHRVATAMYPETIDDEMAIPSTQFTSQQTAVQRLAEPSQMLRHAVENLVNYQDDAELAQRALPELIDLLSDQDHVVVSQAAMVVHQLSKKEASRQVLAKSTPLVKALLVTLERSSDLETTEFTSEILNSISHNQQGLLAIFKTGGIRALIHALSSPIDAVVFNSLTTLHNLLLHQEGAKMTVRLNGGLQKMVGLLQRDNYKFLAIATNCLHILAYGSQEGKLIILASGGPAELVRILHSYNYEKLLFTTARVVKVLSVCPSNKPVLIQAGGMQALAMCLNYQSQRLIQECLWTLRNLSDGATKELNMEPLLQRLVQLLDSTDVNVVTCAVGTLSNLTCNNPTNKSFVCKVGGVQALVQTLRNAGNRDEIAEPAICALRHLTNKHPEAELAQEAIRIHGGLPDVTRMLEPAGKWPSLTATAGLVRNLAFNPQNIPPLRDLGAIQKLSSLLSKAYQALQESPEDSANLIGIKMEKVIESVVGALNAIAVEEQGRAIIINLNMLPTFISLLYNESEGIVSVTLDLLTLLAHQPDVASNIEVQSGVQVLSGLLSSPSEAIRRRAAFLFSLISGDKTPEYTQRLSNEINTLFQAEANEGQWIEAPSQEVPSIYTVEGHVQGPPSMHSGGSRQNIYNTNSTYISQHEVEAPGYGHSGQVMSQMDDSRRQNTHQAHEPWFDTDL